MVDKKMKKFSFYAIPLFALLAMEFFVYQVYFFMPVTLNGKSYMSRKKAVAIDFLRTSKITPKYGDLLSLEKKVLKKGKGNAPILKINGKKRPFNYVLKPSDKITIIKGSNIIEPLVKERQSLETPIENYGYGSFIIIERKGKLGIKEVTMGKYSKIVVKEKIIAQPIPTGISRINIRNRRVVALTFDDGPSKYTKQILKILKKFKVKATFFVIGRNIRKYPRYLIKMRREGHVIGNHTFNHIYMGKAKAKVIRAEIKKTDQWIYKASKVRSKWIRPPGGSLRQSVINYVVLRGKNISLWNIDTEDWKKPPSKIIRSRVLNEIKPGQVILMHDGGGDRTNTVKALPSIIRNIKRRKYKFVTLDELYGYVRPYD